MEAIKAMVQNKVPLAFENFKDMEADMLKLRGTMSEGTILVRRWSSTDDMMPEEEEAFNAELGAWGQEARCLLENLTKCTKEQKKVEADERLEGWKTWVNQAADQGARNAHKFSKLPQEWKPTTTPSQDGQVTADPLGLLEAQRK
eukprot:3737330-Heterocapsa_arctica.AAC.1